jgi:predicted CoA-substrate-specific enzyme activase
MKKYVKVYLGIDVGSVSTKMVALDQSGEIIATSYLPTLSNPLVSVQNGLREIACLLPDGVGIAGVATTGSGRYLADVIAGADLVKNEITCQATAVLHCLPRVQTVIEIGGQDSKIIIIRDGMVADFGMNTVCAAGTGSFLDHQAQRLGVTLDDFSRLALMSNLPVNIGGRCTVFAESDIIGKQQMGHRAEDIIYGLCRALIRNYLSNVALGKDIRPPVAFQGGVAFNGGIVRALEEELNFEVIVPQHHEAMGAIGAALLVDEEMPDGGSRFRGFDVADEQFGSTSFECNICPFQCEIAQLHLNGRLLGGWGGQCDLWQQSRQAECIGGGNL